MAHIYIYISVCVTRMQSNLWPDDDACTSIKVREYKGAISKFSGFELCILSSFHNQNCQIGRVSFEWGHDDE